ncbi:DEKNAAC105031 [Brettanomyces naardenensis]|uniref:Biogenesis of lysosome-related organelles complex 1 subunit KXD1 n=1 Tax=Brettanomyces naardenensis TaxID=13370 RepID=A0A448YSB1_BRENA|nr:DEKNAAC105031 [Brettanomyces naardenensis]
MHSGFTRQTNPSIDGFQFMVHSDDTESSVDTSTATSGASNEGDDSQSIDEEPDSPGNENYGSHGHDHHHTDNVGTSEELIPSGSRFNTVDYLISSLYNSLDSLELDRSLVQQSQISGEMNNVTSKILQTIDELRMCLEEHIAKYEKLKLTIIPEIVSNINQSAKISKGLAEKMKKYYPVEYSKSKDKVLNRITDDQEDIYI